MHHLRDFELSDLNKRALLVLYSMFYVIVVLFFSYVSDSNVALVFIGTIPFLAYIVFFFLFLSDRDINYWGLWVFPVILSLFFYIIWRTGTVGFISDMEGPSVTVLNILLSYITNVFFMFSYVYYKSRDQRLSFERHEKRVRRYFEMQKGKYINEIDSLKKTISDYKEKLEITRENFSVNLRSIEDKCKSINFVIGRVYNNHKGGNEDIRGAIRIERDLYNSFSELTKDFKKEDSEKLVKLLEKINNKLGLLEKAEKDVLPLKKVSLKLERDAHGKDKIIAVLAKNDDDPVLEYYREAKEVCAKLIDFLEE